MLLLLLLVAMYRYIDASIISWKHDVRAYVDVLLADVPEKDEYDLSSFERTKKLNELINQSKTKPIWSLHIRRPREKSLAKTQLLGTLKNTLRFRKRNEERKIEQ
jgi:hypothetical protein